MIPNRFLKTNSWYREIAFVFFFFGITLWIYRREWEAFPYDDHLLFMRLRELVASDWDFFLNGLSLNRTLNTVDFPNDAFLFRPLTNGLLVTLDIFFRDRLLVLGWLSFFWHSLIATSVFALCEAAAGFAVAFALTLLLLVNYAGSEMVLWRHTSPYLIGIWFFLLALRTKRPWVAGVSLLAACFINELFAVFAVIWGTVLTMGSLQYRRFGTTLLISGIVFWVFDGLDIICHEIAAVPPSHAVGGFRRLIAVSKSLRLLTFFAGSFVSPFFVRLDAAGARNFLWHFSGIDGWHRMWLALWALFFAGGAFQWLRRFRAGDPNPLSFLALLGAFVVSLTVGRSSNYLFHSAYYFYFGSFLFAMLTAYAVPRDSFSWKVFVVLFCALSTVANDDQIQRRLAERNKYTAGEFSRIRAARKILDEHPNACLAGEYRRTDTLHVLHYRNFCAHQERPKANKLPSDVWPFIDGQPAVLLTLGGRIKKNFIEPYTHHRSQVPRRQ